MYVINPELCTFCKKVHSSGLITYIVNYLH